MSPLVSPSHCLVLIEYTDRIEQMRNTKITHVLILYILLPVFFFFSLFCFVVFYRSVRVRSKTGADSNEDFCDVSD